MAEWYVATMNDCIFITDEPPRPSTDDRVFRSGPSLVISLRSGSRDAQEAAEEIVAAHNGDLERLSHEFAMALTRSRP